MYCFNKGLIIMVLRRSLAPLLLIIPIPVTFTLAQHKYTYKVLFIRLLFLQASFDNNNNMSDYLITDNS
jgi:hypothetical protein